MELNALRVPSSWQEWCATPIARHALEKVFWKEQVSTSKLPTLPLSKPGLSFPTTTT